MAKAIVHKMEYRPSVCHQTDTEHTHYNIILIKPPAPARRNLDILRNLASKFGGQTAGQLIEAIQYRKSIGIDLSIYGIDFLQIETIPSYQICHKGENESPAIDWNFNLFIPATP